MNELSYFGYSESRISNHFTCMFIPQIVNLFQRADGSSGRRVTPYVIDLGSANGTFVNNQKIDARKYVEVLEKDVLKFGFSSREYVVLHDQSKESEQDDPGIE